MKILFLVLFFLFTSLSCKQNPRNMLSSPPKIEEGITNNNTGSSSTNSGGNIGDDLNSGYGYYDVSVLIDETIKTDKYRISDTDKLLEAYSNMIIDSGSKKARFELSKNGGTETYTFDSNLDLKSPAGTATARDKKFRGVCLVRIYPDATTATTTAKPSLLGGYTIAGIYTEMKKNDTVVSTRIAMTESKDFQKLGYDELIILRIDEPIKDTTASPQNINYRADILFNENEGIPYYNYDPDRTFAKQNIDFIFKRKTQ